jgi:hypothetical protein
VKIWFQNRRSKIKKQNRHPDADSSSGSSSMASHHMTTGTGCPVNDCGRQASKDEDSDDTNEDDDGSDTPNRQYHNDSGNSMAQHLAVTSSSNNPNSAESHSNNRRSEPNGNEIENETQSGATTSSYGEVSRSVGYQLLPLDHRQPNDGFAFSGRELFGMNNLSPRHLQAGIMQASTPLNNSGPGLSSLPYAPFGSSGSTDADFIFHRQMPYLGQSVMPSTGSDSVDKTEDRPVAMHQLSAVVDYQQLSQSNAGFDSQQQPQSTNQSSWLQVVPPLTTMQVKMERLDNNDDEIQSLPSTQKTFQQLVNSPPESWSANINNNNIYGHIVDDNEVASVETTVTNPASYSAPSATQIAAADSYSADWAYTVQSKQ